MKDKVGTKKAKIKNNKVGESEMMIEKRKVEREREKISGWSKT